MNFLNGFIVENFVSGATGLFDMLVDELLGLPFAKVLQNTSSSNTLIEGRQFWISQRFFEPLCPSENQLYQRASVTDLVGDQSQLIDQCDRQTVSLVNQQQHTIIGPFAFFEVSHQAQTQFTFSKTGVRQVELEKN